MTNLYFVCIGFLLCGAYVPGSLADGLSVGPKETLSLGADKWRVAGSITITPDAQLIANNSRLELSGHWQNNGVFKAAESQVVFAGQQSQTIGFESAQITDFFALHINNPAGVQLATPASVNSSLVLVQGHVRLNTSDLTLSETASLGGYSSTAFVVTNDTGQLKKLNLGRDGFLFPIGPEAGNYSPIFASNQGTSDSYGISASTVISHAVLVADQLVNLQWNISEAVNGGGDLLLKPMWQASSAGNSFSESALQQLGAWDGGQYQVVAATEQQSSGGLFSAEFRLPSTASSLVVGNANAIRRSPPALSAITDLLLAEDQAEVFIPLKAIDVDADVISFDVLSSGDDIADLNIIGNLLSITPKKDVFGTSQIRLIASSAGESDQVQFELKINAVNDAPTISPFDIQAAKEEAIYNFSVDQTLINDVDQDQLQVTASLQAEGNLPMWLSFSAADLSFQGVPPAGSAGNYDLKLSASDGVSIAEYLFRLVVAASDTASPSSDAAILNQILKSLSFQRIGANNFAATDVFDNLSLPAEIGFGETITWSSSKPDVLADNGKVSLLLSNVEVGLTAHIKLADLSAEKTYLLNLRGNSFSDSEIADANLKRLNFADIAGVNTRAANVHSDLVLPEHFSGAAVNWRSLPAGFINADTGRVIRGAQDVDVQLRASLQVGAASAQKTFAVIVKGKPTGSQQALAADLADLDIVQILNSNRDMNHVSSDLFLPIVASNGSTIQWSVKTSRAQSPIDTSKHLGAVTRYGEAIPLLLRADLSLDAEQASIEFPLVVLKAEELLVSAQIPKHVMQFTTSDVTTDAEGRKQISVQFQAARNTLLVDASHNSVTAQNVGALETVVELSRKASNNDAAYLSRISHYANSNGSLEQIVQLQKPDGTVRNIKISSLASNVQSEIDASGALSTKLNFPATDITTAIQTEAQVSALGVTQHRVVANGDTTQAITNVENSEVEIQADGGVISTARIFDDQAKVQKIQVKADARGQASHEMTRNGILTRAEFAVAGVKSTVSQGGEVISALDLLGANISVQAEDNGDAKYVVSHEAASTEVQVELPGAVTRINAAGLVATELMLKDMLADGLAATKLLVSTDVQGNSAVEITTPAATGNIKLLEGDMPLGLGSKIQVKINDGNLLVVVQTPLEKPLEF